MSKHRQNNTRSRDAPAQSSVTSAAYVSTDMWRFLCADEYRPLSECPEVMACVNAYADLIGSMTIHLMRNTKGGDERVVNELAKKVDIAPNHDMVRQNFMSMIVRTLMLEGNGNQVTLPQYTQNGLLADLVPLPPNSVSFEPVGNSYLAHYQQLTMRPDEILHFVMHPDPLRSYMGTGYTVGLRDIVKSLRQARTTKNAILESPAPSVIVKVDGLTEDFASKAGRDKLTEQYIESSKSGRPWLIPAEAFSVDQVKP
ncbi:MAG: phage portal protein, partial [Clostridia bacterium]